MTNVYKPIEILVADDDAEDRYLIINALKQHRLANTVREVEDGVQLLEYLHGRGAFAKQKEICLPDLILLDLNMPKMNGIEALKEIRNAENLRHIPVVILTTSEAEQDILNSYKLGVNSFITKPVTFEGLVEVTQALERYWFQIVKLPVDYSV